MSAPFASVPGGTIDVEIAVKNQGDGSALGSQTALYLSEDDALSQDDVLLGTAATGSLTSGASTVVSLDGLVVPELEKGAPLPAGGSGRGPGRARVQRREQRERAALLAPAAALSFAAASECSYALR